MGRKLSTVLRESNLEGIPRWGFWCPGCRHPHMLPLVKPPGTENRGPWTFTGDLEAPTISPSVHIQHGALVDPDTGEVLEPAGSWCHATITAGVITFLEDSHGHKLRGPHPLPRFPHPEDGPPLLKFDAKTILAKQEPSSYRRWRAV